MNRKIVGICTALVAFAAFALVPAMSSGAVLKDTVEGIVKTVETGKKIVAYSEETSKLVGSNGLEVECNENVLTGTVVGNAGIVEGTIEDGWFQGEESTETEKTLCHSTVGPAKVTIPGLTNGTLHNTHWCVKTIKNSDKFVVEPHDCGGTAGEFTFIIDAGGLQCGFKRAANIEGTFTTDTGSHAAVTLTMNNNQTFEKDGGSFLCPASGTLSNVKFQMYTDTGVTSNGYRETINTADPVFMTE
jgi:hypothetical protein